MIGAGAVASKPAAVAGGGGPTYPAFAFKDLPGPGTSYTFNAADWGGGNLAAGDLIIVFGAQYAPGKVSTDFGATPLTGGTLLQTNISANNDSLILASKVAAGGESSITVNNATPGVDAMLVLYIFNGGSVRASTGGFDTAAPWQVPSMSPAVGGTFVAFGYGFYGGANLSVPTGFSSDRVISSEAVGRKTVTSGATGAQSFVVLSGTPNYVGLAGVVVG